MISFSTDQIKFEQNIKNPYLNHLEFLEVQKLISEAKRNYMIVEGKNQILKKQQKVDHQAIQHLAVKQFTSFSLESYGSDVLKTYTRGIKFTGKQNILNSASKWKFKWHR